MRKYFSGWSFLVTALVVLLLSACGGGGGGGSADTGGGGTTTPAATSTLTLTLPGHGLAAKDLAIVVISGDPLSEAIATDYQTLRGVPAANILRVTLSNASDTLSSSDFATLKAQVDALMPASAQAILLAWNMPSRVVGSTCSMSITSAMSFGYDPKYCGGCATTAASSYYDTETSQPVTDVNLRPTMMLGARTTAEALTLINRGVAADGTLPSGTGWLYRTSDSARNLRYADYINLPAAWNGQLTLNYVDNSSATGSDTLVNQSNVLFYFTGLSSVANLGTNTYLPGAVGDDLTSYAGVLPDGNGQTTVTDWLVAGLTASYGTVEEPCNQVEKFTRASVLIDHYYRGDSLIEAYWKSVQWPGQGLFVGEPLAKPFPDTPSFAIVNSQYQFSTRSLRVGGNYSLDYQNTAGAWTSLASFIGTRGGVRTMTAPLAPASATHIRWTGPCPANSSSQCTLATSS